MGKDQTDGLGQLARRLTEDGWPDKVVNFARDEVSLCLNYLAESGRAPHPPAGLLSIEADTAARWRLLDLVMWLRDHAGIDWNSEEWRQFAPMTTDPGPPGLPLYWWCPVEAADPFPEEEVARIRHATPEDSPSFLVDVTLGDGSNAWPFLDWVRFALLMHAVDPATSQGDLMVLALNGPVDLSNILRHLPHVPDDVKAAASLR